MTSAAAASTIGAAFGSTVAGGGMPGAPGLPGSYSGHLTFEQWKKKKGLLPGQYLARDAWEEWQNYNTKQSELITNDRSRLTLKPGPEPEPEDIGSTVGFEKVQRFLRQQRATGRVISPNETRMAWQGYWDTWASKQAERERIGIERERLDLQEKQWAWQRGFAEEGRELETEREESSAAAAGGSMIGMGIGFAVGGPAGAVVGGMIGGMIGGSK